MEAVHLSGIKAEDGDHALDFDLARNGIKWLRENISDPDSNIRRRVIEAKSNINSMEQLQRQRGENGERQREQVLQREIEQEAAAEAEKVAQAQQTAAEVKQAGYQAEFKQALEEVQMEGDNIDGLLSLSEHLEISDELGIAGQEKDSFPQALAGRVSEYLQDPDELANDMILLAHLPKSSGTDEASVPTPVDRCRGILLTAIDDLVVKSHYRLKDFTPAIINKWLNILVDARFAKEQRTGAQLISRSPDALPPAASANRDKTNIGSAMDAYGGEVIAQTLHEVIYIQPERFIDTLYRIAEEGLDAKDNVVADITVDLLRHCLRSEPLAIDILLAATATRHLKMQRKAIDLRETLMKIDPYCRELLADPHDATRAARLNEEELKIIKDIYNKYFKMNNRGLSQQDKQELDQRSDDNTEQFRQWATTTEGATTTLYGRFAIEKIRQSPKQLYRKL